MFQLRDVDALLHEALHLPRVSQQVRLDALHGDRLAIHQTVLHSGEGALAHKLHLQKVRRAWAGVRGAALGQL